MLNRGGLSPAQQFQIPGSAFLTVPGGVKVSVRGALWHQVPGLRWAQPPLCVPGPVWLTRRTLPPHPLRMSSENRTGRHALCSHRKRMTQRPLQILASPEGEEGSSGQLSCSPPPPGWVSIREPQDTWRAPLQRWHSRAHAGQHSW